MATIAEAIRRMMTDSISSQVVPDSRITHGYRPQGSELPAIHFDVISTTRETLDSVMKTSVSFVGTAETTIGATALEAVIKQGFAKGTYLSISIDAVTVTSEALDAPIIGEGDEQMPATYTINADIHWRS